VDAAESDSAEIEIWYRVTEAIDAAAAEGG
jgi:hypothetical protein